MLAYATYGYARFDWKVRLVEVKLYNIELGNPQQQQEKLPPRAHTPCISYIPTTSILEINKRCIQEYIRVL